MIRRTWATVVLALGVAACGSSSSGTQQPAPSEGNRDLITAEEIAAADVADAFEAVQRLRPRWLRYRGGFEADDFVPVVYADRARMGGPEALRSIPAVVIVSIRFRSPTEATTLYGTGHAGGVIEVTRRRGPP